MENNIFIQDGRYINVLWPSPVVRAGIFCEEERQQIKLLVRHGFMPHHSAVGKGRCTRRHWNMEKYRGKHGVGFKLITASSISSNMVVRSSHSKTGIGEHSSSAYSCFIVAS